jgi:hypothetical protein
VSRRQGLREEGGGTVSPKLSLAPVLFSLMVFSFLGACSPREVPNPLCINGTYLIHGDESLRLVIAGSRYTLNYGGEQLSGKVEFRLSRLDEGEPHFEFYPEAGRFSDSNRSRLEQRVEDIGADPFFLSDFENLQTPFRYAVAQQWNAIFVFMDYDATYFTKPC